MYALAEGDLPSDRTFILGTGGMVRHLQSCEAEVDFVGTETGMLHRLQQERPDKTFTPLREDAICEYMKTITLPKVYRALRDDVYHVSVPGDVADKARLAIERMVSVGLAAD
jgi:quinolinate synthase